jgi:hypothetical protein
MFNHKGFEFSSDDCSTDEQSEALDHFRNVGDVLGRLDDLPRVPTHQESLEELDLMNHYLFMESFREPMAVLDENTKSRLAKKEQDTEEMYQIGEFLYLYCVSFEGVEDELSEPAMAVKHCETLKAFLANREAYISGTYNKAVNGKIINHPQLLALSESINIEKNRLDRLMKNIKVVGV